MAIELFNCCGAAESHVLQVPVWYVLMSIHISTAYILASANLMDGQVTIMKISLSPHIEAN